MLIDRVLRSVCNFLKLQTHYYITLCLTRLPLQVGCVLCNVYVLDNVSDM